MTGIEATASPGSPWAGGSTRSFTRDEVVAIGKLRRYNDSVTRFLVRLGDGAEVFVNASEQPYDDRKWIYKIGRGFTSGLASRDIGFAIQWKEIAP